jgi:hypothetical protein
MLPDYLVKKGEGPDWWNPVSWFTDPPPAPPSPAIQGVLDSQSKHKAITDILSTLGVAGAVGVGARGLMGASHFLGRPDTDLTRTIGPQVLQIGTPVYTRKKDEERARLMAKSASPWWTIPGLTAAGIGGLYGGYHLMDWTMNRKRKEDLASEVEAAKQKYRQALIGQFDPANVPTADKIPSLPSLPTLKNAALQEDLNRLADRVEKVAQTIDKTAEWGNNAIGIATTLAGLLAGGAGVAAYNMTKARSPNKMLEQAIKQREKERWARRPPEIYAIPQPVHLTHHGELQPSGAPIDLNSPSVLGS